MKDILIKARRAVRFLFYQDVPIEDQMLVSNTLDDSDLEILFWKLNKADRHHSIEVLHRTMKHTNNPDVLMLALLHDIGKSISEYSWLFRIFTELGIYKSQKSQNYKNHEDIGFELLKELQNEECSKYYFDNLLSNKNEILDKTDF
tara:strand:+ start:3390 stop:3827 length:438 start_codon:yes stop_codon:yes gene_type:complete